MEKENILNDEHTKNLLGEALHNCDDGELYLEESTSENFSYDDNALKDASFNQSKGYGIRAVNDEITGYSHSNDINKESIKESIDTLSSVKKGYSGTQVIEPKKTNSKLYSDASPIDGISFKKKIKFLEDVNDYGRSIDKNVRQLTVGLSGIQQKVDILRPSGQIFSDLRPLVRLNIAITIEKNGKKETGSVGLGGRFSYDNILQENTWKKQLQEALRQANTMIDAKDAPAGEQTVVLGPGWPGILLHEAIGHGLEGDFNRKKISVFTELMGSLVANKEVTVFDDGTIPDRRGSFNFDDEGTPSQKTTLIEKGVLVGLMQDRQNARLMNVSATGNGRRQSYAYQPMPRMSNTLMANGKHDPEDILKSTKKGIYAKTFGGGQVDITNGKFVFSASEAYMIENGKVTFPIKGATLIGSGFEVLKNVEFVGNDLKMDPGIGTCGKNGQGVPVGVGQPTLKIKGLTVGGTSG